jgi:hypothetical protein
MTCKRRFVTITTVLLMLTAAPHVVTGQEIAGSFEQLRVLVKPGDRVRVTDATGRETTGKIADLSPTTLALLVDGQRREILAGDVSTIRQRRSDSLATGARVGFAIGAGIGLVGGVAFASVYDEVGPAQIIAISFMYGAVGAGMGVGMDALVETEQVIYAGAAPTSAAPAAVKIRPVFTRARRGVVVSIGF